MVTLKPDPENVLDIIVPAYENPDITARCLAALILFKPKGSRIIYINNGSKDPRMKQLRSMVEPTGGLYVEVKKNRGPYAAVNKGLGLGDSLLVAVVCNDVVVLPNTIQNLMGALRPELGIPVVGAAEIPDINEYDFNQVLEKARQAGLLGSGRMIAQQGFFSCFLAFRSVFDPGGVGLFDERFYVTFGDTDWEERYRAAGLIYGKVEGAPVYHGRSTTRKRLGLETDVRNDETDHAAFKQKWAAHSEVLSRHGGDPTPEQRGFGTKSAWATGEK